MIRFFICLCFAACCAGSVFSQTVTGGNAMPNNGGIGGQPEQGENIFEELRKSYDQHPQKGNGKDINSVKKLLEDNGTGPKGTVTKGAAAICPICREMLYRHSEDGFRCIPKDQNGDPLPMVEIKWKKVLCPVCQAKFLGAMPGNVNSRNGVDRDTCIHSVGKAAVQSNVWTCPDCGYAALVDSFGLSWDGKPISEETKEFVRKTVSPVMFTRMCKLAGIKENFVDKGDKHNLRRFDEYLQQDDLQQDQINDWIKYDNAVKIYKQEKAPSTLMARLYLEAAHACRRELNGEIAVPVLHSHMEESLSVSLRRIQHDITAGCIEIRRSRNQGSLVDPNRTDTDAQVLCDAAAMIMKMGEVDGNRINQDRTRHPDPKNFYTTGDMFVLCLRYAGFLDRLGRMDEADSMLVKAKTFIPADMAAEAGAAAPEAAEFVAKQLKLLRDYVDGRRKCLELEKECLNRAMWENLVAIHHKQVRFINPKTLLSPPEKNQLNPSETAYMIGELARRCQEPGAAPAFLAAADAILKLQFSEVDKEDEKANASKADAPELYAAAKERSKKLNSDWGLLQSWTAEQLKLSTTGGKIDEQVKAVLDEVLIAAGIDPATFKIPEIAATDSTRANVPAVRAPAAKTGNAGSATEPAPAATVPIAAAAGSEGTIKTRDALLKMYFEAISKYVKEKKSNPASLAALVDAHYIPAENSCLNEQGQLICPETHEQLLYAKNFQIGNSQDFVLFRAKNAVTSKILFANGEIRIPVQKK